MNKCFRSGMGRIGVLKNRINETNYLNFILAVFCSSNTQRTVSQEDKMKVFAIIILLGYIIFGLLIPRSLLVESAILHSQADIGNFGGGRLFSDDFTVATIGTGPGLLVP